MNRISLQASTTHIVLAANSSIGIRSVRRDALLASLLDGVRSAGQRDAHVRSAPTPRGYRLGPLHQAVDEETESNHLR